MPTLTHAEQTARQEIREAFEAFYAGRPARVPYVGCGLTNTLGMQYQPVSDAIADILSEGASKAALIMLLQGVTDIAAFRKVLVEDYIDQHADLIAQQRVVFDAPAVHPWLMREAA